MICQSDSNGFPDRLNVDVAISYLLDDLGALSAARLREIPERIQRVVAPDVSSKNRDLILWRLFLSLEQTLADVLRGAKNRFVRREADVRHDRIEPHQLTRINPGAFDCVYEERDRLLDEPSIEFLLLTQLSCDARPSELYSLAHERKHIPMRESKTPKSERRHGSYRPSRNQSGSPTDIGDGLDYVNRIRDNPREYRDAVGWSL